MKILIKECKKIMDIRVLLVIAVFTVLFYQLFLEVTIYPVGGQTTDSPYDMPFYAELIESWGTSLPREGWSKLDEKRKELEDKYQNEFNQKKSSIDKDYETKLSSFNSEINSEIIAGLVIKIGDDIIDMSLKHKLEDLSKNITR